MQLENRSLGERCHDALLVVAQKKSDALRAKKLAERKYDQVLLMETEGTIAEKQARARQHPAVMKAEDQHIESESALNMAKAKADGLQIEFEEWRSRQANSRAEMQLR